MKYLIVSILVLVTRPSLARELYEYYTGVRQLGMGGAYTAVVNDETALLSNPAGLGKLRGYIFTLADPELSASGSTTEMMTDSNYTRVFTPQGLLDTLNSQRGKHFHTKAQVFPSMVFTNFGLGLHVQYVTDAEVDSTGTNFDVRFIKDVTAALGYNLRFAQGIVKLGFAARFIDRTEIDRQLPANSTGLTYETLASEGFGVAGDVGLILSAPVVYLPSLAVVVRDVGNTRYTLSDGIFAAYSRRPNETKQSIDAGIAIQPILSNHSRLTLTVDYHDITGLAAESANGSTPDSMKRVHAGMEFNIHDFFFVRGGMNQRYWTAGVEISTQRFQIQAATYGEEVGTSTSPREDRRYVGKLGFRF